MPQLHVNPLHPPNHSRHRGNSGPTHHHTTSTHQRQVNNHPSPQSTNNSPDDIIRFVSDEDEKHTCTMIGYSFASFLVSTLVSVTLAVVIVLGAISSKAPKTCFVYNSNYLTYLSGIENANINDSFVMTRDMFSQGQFVIEKYNELNADEIISLISSSKLQTHPKQSIGTLQLRTWSVPAMMDFIYSDGRGISFAMGSYFTLSDTVQIGHYDNSASCVPSVSSIVGLDSSDQGLFGGSIKLQVNSGIKTFNLKDAKGVSRAMVQQRVDFIPYEMPIVKLDGSNQVIALLRRNILHPQEQWILTIVSPLSGSEISDGFGYSQMMYMVGYMTFRDK